jgi:hypothetical protein
MTPISFLKYNILIIKLNIHECKHLVVTLWKIGRESLEDIPDNFRIYEESLGFSSDRLISSIKNSCDYI